MRSLVTFTLAAVVLGTAFAASAASRQRPPANTDSTIISDACKPTGPPCRTHRDSW
jgi:hypothetical protein